MGTKIEGNILIEGNSAIDKFISPLDLGVDHRWYAPDVSSIILDETNKVSQWDDTGIIGGKNISQSVGSKRPTYNINQINGLPTITFELFNFLRRNSDSDLNIIGDISIFAVVRYKNLSVPQKIIAYDGAVMDTKPYNTIYDLGLIAGGKLSTFHEYEEGQNQNWESNIEVDDPSEALIYMIRDTNEKKWILGIKSFTQNIQENNSYTTNPNGGSLSKFFVGTSGAGSTIWRGEIGEINLFKRKLDNNEILMMKQYANKKWGV